MRFASPPQASQPLHVVNQPDLESWLTALPAHQAAWARASGFGGGIGETLLLPGEDHKPAAAAIGYGSEETRRRGRFALSAGAAKLPAATYHLATNLPPERQQEELLGWLLHGYRFTRYRSGDSPPAPTTATASLVAPEGTNIHHLETLAHGEALTRDLINTPANDMGPAQLEAATARLADEHNASLTAITGEELIRQNFPMIHTVGRASPRAPRLLDLQWGTQGPQLCLVGKGVCFDTGGLNLKPGASMGLMKKDMGGAATVLGLAHMIMALHLPLRLRVLIPAAENAVSGDAFRPGDILTARNGMSVEVNNTDAEGRLVLGDALSYACEGAQMPDLLVSMATLTGAARVALGPDLAPFYSTVPALSQALQSQAPTMADPIWEMPFWEPYEARIEPGIADLDNAPGGGMAGSITAALFLRRFVAPEVPYLHFDIYGWQPSPAPAQPKGGKGQGARALLAALPGMLNL